MELDLQCLFGLHVHSCTHLFLTPWPCPMELAVRQNCTMRKPLFRQPLDIAPLDIACERFIYSQDRSTHYLQLNRQIDRANRYWFFVVYGWVNVPNPCSKTEQFLTVRERMPLQLKSPSRLFFPPRLKKSSGWAISLSTIPSLFGQGLY